MHDRNAEKKTMKKVVCFLVIFAIFASLAGCAGQKDTITFHSEWSSLTNEKRASYEVSIGNKVGGASVTAELWQNGECAEGTPLTLNGGTKTIDISLLITELWTENAEKSLNVQIGTDEQSGSVLAAFPLPEGIIGYSFAAYNDKEKIEVNPGEDVILCALAFDTGSGVRSVDCKSLADEPGKLKEYSCIAVIRMVFTAAQIAPQAEASEKP